MAFRVILLLVVTTSVFGQEDGSETGSALASTRARARTDSLMHAYSLSAYNYFNREVYDSAEIFYKIILKHYRKSNYQPGLAFSMSGLGAIKIHQDALDSGIYYNTEAYELNKQLQDSMGIAGNELNLGMAYNEKGHYETSLGFLLSAATKLEAQHDTRVLGSCYNSIGTVYYRTGEFHAALDYYSKSLAIRKKMKMTGLVADSYSNLGNVYLSMDQLDSAAANYLRSLNLAKESGYASNQAGTLNNLGELMIKKGNFEKAREYLVASLNTSQDETNKMGEVVSRNNLGLVYTKQGFLSMAEQELKRGERLAKALGIPEHLKTNYEIQVMLYKEKNDYPRALDYSQQLLVIKDSLLTKDKARSIAEMQTKYESLKKEDRIFLLEKEGLLQAVELDRRQIWIRSLVLAVVLVCIIGILVYLNLRMVRKNKKHIELLMKELHHRVKNNLQIISSLLSLQSQQITDDTAMRAVKSSESRINAMALIHRKLYTIDRNRTVDIKEYITELIQYLVYSYGFHEKNFKLDLEIKEISIDVDKAIPLGLILNELISNAFKHAYTEHPNPELRINLGYPYDNALHIRIQDNGGGYLNGEATRKKTFGMKIVTTLIKELKGSLEVKSDNGTRYELNIPI